MTQPKSTAASKTEINQPKATSRPRPTPQPWPLRLPDLPAGRKKKKKNKKKMPVRWSPPWNSSYGGVFMQIQLKHYDFSLRTSVPVSLAWARCAFASSLVIQGSACLDSLLICSCHPITTSKDVTLGRKTGWSEGNKKKKKNMERCSFFYWSTIQTRTGLTFFFFTCFFSPPSRLHFGFHWSPIFFFFLHFPF